MAGNLPGFINESQISEAKRAEICWTNYPRSEVTRGYLVQAEIKLNNRIWCT